MLIAESSPLYKLRRTPGRHAPKSAQRRCQRGSARPRIKSAARLPLGASKQAGDPDSCWLTELFLMNDLTVPGLTTKQGRRQEPCTTSRSPAYLAPARDRPTLPCRRPPSVRDSEGEKQQNPFFGLCHGVISPATHCKSNIRHARRFSLFLMSFSLHTLLPRGGRLAQ